MSFKIDIHNHILPERWPDLKEVSTYFAANFRDTRTELSLRCDRAYQADWNIERFGATLF